MRRIIRITDGVLAVLCAVLMTFVAVGSHTLPDAFICYDGVPVGQRGVYSVAGEASRSVDFQGETVSEDTLRLLNVIPVKTVTVTAKPSGSVIVGGEAFGIKLYTDGVIVVGMQSVDTGEGAVNPSEEAGLQTGDIIAEIDGRAVYSAEEVTAILNENNGASYAVKIKRDGRYREFTLTPVYSPREGCYKAGLWVRDSTAGIGTVTFYNPDNGVFASLGHPVNDVDTGELMPLLKGEAVKAEVVNVQRAAAGMTGSLWCDFKSEAVGQLLENTSLGLYGRSDSVPQSNESYPIASAQEVHRGAAQIRSTVSGVQPQYYDVEITKVSYNKEGGQRDIVFRVTDDALLKATGGIVQGMSGSPVIQDGKLVGAVTHVIVNNPVKGYAVFAQTMYEKSFDY